MDVLRNKQNKSYDKVSRYSLFPIYYNTNDGKYIYGMTAHLSVNTPYLLHKVKNGDTFDSIALDYYDNPTYYWVIADFNQIQDPFLELVEDTYIKVPTFSAIEYDI